MFEFPALLAKTGAFNYRVLVLCVNEYGTSFEVQASHWRSHCFGLQQASLMAHKWIKRRTLYALHSWLEHSQMIRHTHCVLVPNHCSHGTHSSHAAQIRVSNAATTTEAKLWDVETLGGLNGFCCCRCAPIAVSSRMFTKVAHLEVTA